MPRSRWFEVSAFFGLVIAVVAGGFGVVAALAEGPCSGDGGSPYSEPGFGDQFCASGGLIVLGGIPLLFVVLAYFWPRKRGNGIARFWLMVAAGVMLMIAVLLWAQGLSRTA